jgi:predicted DNA-binding protein
MERTISLPEEVQSRLDEIAIEEGKTVPEIVREATERYIAHRYLDRLAARGRAHSTELGLRPSDVSRLINEARRER